MSLLITTVFSSVSWESLASILSEAYESWQVQFTYISTVTNKEEVWYVNYSNRNYSVQLNYFDENSKKEIKQLFQDTNKRNLLNEISRKNLISSLSDKDFSSSNQDSFIKNNSFSEDSFNSFDSDFFPSNLSSHNSLNLDDDSDEDLLAEESEEQDELDEIVRTTYEIEFENLRNNRSLFENASTLSPRDYQLEPLTQIILGLKEKKKWLAVLPTWFWKTFMSAYIANHFKWEHTWDKPFRVLFLVHKNDIVYQTARLYDSEKNVKWPFTNYFWVDSVWVLTWGQKFYKRWIYNSLTPGKINDVVVANINTLAWFLESDKWKEILPRDYFDIIIADECHRSISWRYRSCIDYFDYKYLLWVTATPNRVCKRHKTEDLLKYYGCDDESDFLCHKKLTDSIDEWNLATPFYFIRFNKETFQTLLYETKLSIVANNLWITRNIKAYKDNLSEVYSDAEYLYSNNKKTVIFCERVAVADQLYLELQKRFWKDVIPMYGTSKTTDTVWGEKITPYVFNKKIDQFKSLDRWFIITVDLFIEGTDIPEIDALMLLRPTTSHRVYFQVLWRGLRKTPTKDYCLVFDYNFNTTDSILLEKKFELYHTIKNKISSKYTHLASTTDWYISELTDVLNNFDEKSSRYKTEYRASIWELLDQNEKFQENLLEACKEILELNKRNLSPLVFWDELSMITFKNVKWKKVKLIKNFCYEDRTKIRLQCEVLQACKTIEEIKNRLNYYNLSDTGQIHFWETRTKISIPQTVSTTWKKPIKIKWKVERKV